MKKYVIFILLIFSIGLLHVNATDTIQVEKLTCTYQSSSRRNNNYFILEVKYNISYVTSNVESARLYLAESISPSASKSIRYESNDINELGSAFVNFSSPLFNTNTYRYINYSDSTDSTSGFFSQNMQDYSGGGISEELCPDNIYISETYENNEYSYEFYACEGNACSGVNNYVTTFVENDNTEIVSSSVKAATATEIENMFDGNNTSNVQDNYNQAQQNIEKYCDEELDTYDEELCAQAQKEAEDSVDHGSDVGKTEAELQDGYSYFKSNLQFGDLSDCDSYLGFINDPNDPAYYLNFAFNLLKYIAIIILLVFTIVEYAKAIPSGKDDAIKKATMNTVKRMIIAVIIFFLPTLINFIFDLLDIVSTDATCGLGITID